MDHPSKEKARDGFLTAAGSIGWVFSALTLVAFVALAVGIASFVAVMLILMGLDVLGVDEAGELRRSLIAWNDSQ